MSSFLRLLRRNQDASTRAQLFAERLDIIKELAERFTYDLGLLIAGHDTALADYVDGRAAARLQEGVEPFLASGEAMRPDFGEYAELRILGDLSSASLVESVVEFEDRSVRETVDGRLLSTAARRLQLTLMVDLAAKRVLDYRLRVA